MNMDYLIQGDIKKGDENLISLSYLNVLSGGDRKFEREIIELYLEKTPSIFGRLEKAIKESKLELIRFISHRLRPSFYLMGIQENGLLQLIEERANVPTEMEKIRIDFIELKYIYETSLVSIKKVLNDLIDDDSYSNIHPRMSGQTAQLRVG